MKDCISAQKLISLSLFLDSTTGIRGIVNFSLCTTLPRFLFAKAKLISPGILQSWKLIITSSRDKMFEIQITDPQVSFYESTLPPDSSVNFSNILLRFCFFLDLDFSMVSSLMRTMSILDTMDPITPSILSTRFCSLDKQNNYKMHFPGRLVDKNQK